CKTISHYPKTIKMKKLIFTIAFILNISVSFHDKDFTIEYSQKTYAQLGCPNNVSGSGLGGGGGIFGFLGNVFVEIGTAIGNVATAVADFFSGGDGDGETMGEENGDDNDYGWIDLGEDFEPPPVEYPTPWDDPDFDNTGFGTNEWEITNNWNYYYELYQEASNRPPQNAKYYITVNSTYYRYYNNDTIAMPQSDSNVLVLHNENPSYQLGLKGTKWKENDTVRNVEMRTCWVMTSQVRTSNFKVHDDIADTSLIKNPLVVYSKPIVIFQRGDNYDGEYGFDDSSHKHPTIANNDLYKPGTEITTIAGTNYVVPWMSLLDGDSATIKLKKIMDNKIKNDKAFGVHLKTSNNSIKINGVNDLDLSYDALKNLNTLTVTANEWDANEANKAIASIYAITYSGDTIGKLNISSQKPVLKKVVFVYVNTGTGYRTDMPKNLLLDSLNSRSHNQLFRKWVVDATHSAGGKDTLDLSVEYAANPALFMGDSLVLRKIDSFYKDHKGIDIYFDVNDGMIMANSNDTAKVHFVFLMNYRLAPVGGSETMGITNLGGIKSVFWRAAYKQTIAHEMGHLLKLRHIFSPMYGVPEYSTTNLMDYYIGVDRTNMFYFAQWIDTF
ncbi:MAG TPA: hypothetical protein PLR98_09685, partial [Chitinophagaceae bacterium]|nr:hypothetical protein [Chitinophagaceae bacterium]